MKPYFFENQEEFRQWLEKNHDKETELLVGFYKTKSDKPSITWPESVDQALCYGWIDGVRKSLGEESYTIRFTPRKATSIWSEVNIRKMKELQEKGLMTPAGLAAFEKRKESKSGVYSHERKEEAKLPDVMEREFRANKKAWEYFMNQAPSYRKAVIHLVISAKQEKTRQSRFEKLVIASAEGKRIQ